MHCKNDCFLSEKLSDFYSSFFVFQDVARLTVQDLADGLQCRKAYGFGLARFQHRKVCRGDSHPFGKLVERHFSYCHHHIQIHNYCHKSILLSFFVKWLNLVLPSFASMILTLAPKIALDSQASGSYNLAVEIRCYNR